MKIGVEYFWFLFSCEFLKKLFEKKNYGHKKENKFQSGLLTILCSFSYWEWRKICKPNFQYCSMFDISQVFCRKLSSTKLTFMVRILMIIFLMYLQWNTNCFQIKKNNSVLSYLRVDWLKSLSPMSNFMVEPTPQH